jgi:dipeptidyl aminopeptidase/acylaminoacyl peptidase
MQESPVEKAIIPGDSTGGTSVMRQSYRFLAVALLTAMVMVFAGSPSSAYAGALSVEEFFRKPQFLSAVLSPSGRYLAVSVPNGDHRVLGIIDLDKREPVAKIAGAYDGDILNIGWQTDERLIVFIGDLQGVAGELPSQRGLVAINRDSNYPRNVPGSIVRVIPGSNEVLLAAHGRSRSMLDLYRYDTATGAKTLLSFDAPENVSRWVIDFDGVPRAFVSEDILNNTSAWYVRKRGVDSWTKVEGAAHGGLHASPLQFDVEGKILYVASRRDGADRESIYEYDVESGSWGEAVIRHPERDIGPASSRFIADYRERKLLGLQYADDRPSVVWFDAEWGRIQKSVDTALPETVNLLQRSQDPKRWIVVAYSDRNPGDAYLLDGKTMQMEKLFSYEPWIDPKAMLPRRWIRYPARDGLSIRALLTVPLGADGKRVPLVVRIHGGPNVQATAWGYDPEVQFFASRGYAVLEPQFRGTEGFGWKHLSSGYRKWGEEMQDDLEDGVKWAVAQGIADPSRVCFYGGSYGGYAAIWGAIKNAALIKCAVAVAAVTSIDYIFDNAQTDTFYLDRSSLAIQQVGDPKTERARFKRVNPLDNADKVGVPILLAYGGSDRRVPIAHGVDFRAALDRYHKDYEWVEYAAEGHGFNRDQDAFDFYHRVERFLAKYLSADAAAGNSAVAPGK